MYSVANFMITKVEIATMIINPHVCMVVIVLCVCVCCVVCMGVCVPCVKFPLTVDTTIFQLGEWKKSRVQTWSGLQLLVSESTF